MKKILVLLLIIVLLLGGVFLWKGGHHALYLAAELRQWAETKDADHSLSLQINQPSFSVEEEPQSIKPVVRQFSLQADTFRMGYQGRSMIGLSVGEYSAYLLDGILYMDTGKAYTLPEIDPEGTLRRKLLTSLVLYGRVTKSDNGYHVEMETQQLSLSLSVVMDDGISSMTLNTEYSVDGAPVHILADLTAKETAAHPLPQPVRDAIVLAQMEPPVKLQEILTALQPVVAHLEDTEADFLLSAECGILKVSNNGVLRREDNSLILQFGERELPLKIMPELSNLSPVSAGFALLRSADYTETARGAEFIFRLPAGDVEEFCKSLVPEFIELPISMTDSQIVIKIRDEKLEMVRFHAEGTVSLVLANIPVLISAEILPK